MGMKSHLLGNDDEISQGIVLYGFEGSLRCRSFGLTSDDCLPVFVYILSAHDQLHEEQALPVSIQILLHGN